MAKTVRTDVFTFPGAMTPPAVGSPDGSVWRSKITKTAGSPNVVATAGVMALTLDTQNEVQNVKLYMGNQLSYPFANLMAVRFWASLTASAFNNVTAIVGVATNENDAVASISKGAWFKVTTSNAVVLDSTDGTNTNTGIATNAVTWSGGTYKLFQIDFTAGLGDVRFYCDNGDGDLRRQAQKTTFNMAAATGNVQLYAQLQKTAAAASATLNVRRIEVDYSF